MPSTTGHYDQSLLASVPVATKAQLQEGYNPDLLQPGKASPTPSPVRFADPEAGATVLVNKEYQIAPPPPSRPKVPFWRTQKGIIIIVVAVVVVIAVAVGGGVGGSRRKSNTNQNTASIQGTSDNSTSSASQADGGDVEFSTALSSDSADSSSPTDVENASSAINLSDLLPSPTSGATKLLSTNTLSTDSADTSSPTEITNSSSVIDLADISSIIAGQTAVFTLTTTNDGVPTRRPRSRSSSFSLLLVELAVWDIRFAHEWFLRLWTDFLENVGFISSLFIASSYDPNRGQLLYSDLTIGTMRTELWKG